MNRIFAVILLTTSLIAPPALADATSRAGQCYTIADYGYRALCRAEAHKERGTCYNIQHQDLRAECLAEAHK